MFNVVFRPSEAVSEDSWVGGWGQRPSSETNSLWRFYEPVWMLAIVANPECKILMQLPLGLYYSTSNLRGFLRPIFRPLSRTGYLANESVKYLGLDANFQVHSI